MAKSVFLAMSSEGKGAHEVVAAQGLSQMRDAQALASIAQAAIEAHPEEATRYRAGKRGLLGFFMAQVMEATQGTADPRLTSALLRELLESTVEG